MVSLPRELTVATPSAPITTWSSKPAKPPVRLTRSGNAVPGVSVGVPVGVLVGVPGGVPVGAGGVAVGSVGALGGGVVLAGPPPAPVSSPHPASASPAITVMTAYLLRFLTPHGYPQACCSLQL